MYIALAIFIGSALAILVSLESGSRGLAMLGGVGNLVACVLFVLSIWMPRRKVDWERIEAEQRLWESGPLGRRWLRVRKRLDRRWKL